MNYDKMSFSIRCCEPQPTDLSCFLEGACKELSEHWSLTYGLVSLVVRVVTSNRIPRDWRWERASAPRYVLNPEKLPICHPVVESLILVMLTRKFLDGQLELGEDSLAVPPRYSVWDKNYSTSFPRTVS